MERLESRLALTGFSVWQNSALAADVDSDGTVTPLDALVVLNGIQDIVEIQDIVAQDVAGGAGVPNGGGSIGMLPLFEVQLPPDFAPQVAGEPLYLDVNGDGQASMQDYSAVVDALAGIIASQFVQDSVDLDSVDPDDVDPADVDPADVVPGDTIQETLTPLPDDDTNVNAQTGPTCGVLPATAGPATFNKYQDATGQWIVGTPAFTPLNDAQNEGLLVGQERNDLSLLVSGRPFDEGADSIAPLHADNWFYDDTYYAWLEVVAVRTYTRYDLIPGTTLSNATSEPLSQTLTLSQTKTSGWTVGAGLTSTTTQEVVGNTGVISAKASNALQKQVTVATSAQTSQTVTTATSITAPPCSVVSLYQIYDVVEVQIDYIQWVDSAVGLALGFTPVRGTFLASSLIDVGHHTEQAGPQAGGGLAPLPPPMPLPAPVPIPMPAPAP